MSATNGKERRVSLRALAQDAGEVEIMGYNAETKASTNWRWVAVKQIDGYTYASVKELQKMEQTGVEPDTGALYETVRHLIPEANDVEIMKLNAMQCGKILEIALSGVLEIEKLADRVSEKNADAPVDLAERPAPSPKTSSRPASSQRTR